MKDFDINKRIVELCDLLSVGQGAFAREIGISTSRMSNITTLRNKPDSEMLQAIIGKYRNVNSEWLLVGIGEPFKAGCAKTPGKYCPPDSMPDVIDENAVNIYSLKSDSVKDIQDVPLYSVEAYAGLVPLFSDAIKHEPIDFIKIPNLPKCDGAIYITGDSMYPLLKSGDIVLYKQVTDILNGIFWGEMYLISIDMSGEEYVTVKYIQKSDNPDCVRLVSYNSHHSEKDVLITSIRALAFVKASIRINSMK